MTMERDATANRKPRRVRHEVKVRTLEVAQTQRLSPSMLRLTLRGEALKDFASAGFDDHVKLFLPEDGQAPRLPVVGPNGIAMPDGQPWPTMRDYTVRRFDEANRNLDIDFALHEAGPATQWALASRPGDPVWIGGPRGSMIVPLAFDWYLLIGDETALPAIARQLEELPDETRVIAVIEVQDATNEIPLSLPRNGRLVWVHRGARPAGSPEPLREALAALERPEGDFHAWLACESSVAKDLRDHLLAHWGANPKWMRASGYWRRGDAGAHDHFDEEPSGPSANQG